MLTLKVPMKISQIQFTERNKEIRIVNGPIRD